MYTNCYDELLGMLNVVYRECKARSDARMVKALIKYVVEHKDGLFVPPTSDEPLVVYDSQETEDGAPVVDSTEE